MKFSYDLYLRGCCIIPIGVTIFFALFLFIGLVSFVKKIIQHCVEFEDVIKVLLVILVVSFFFLMNIGRLCYGGVYLIREKENQAVVIEGVIERTEYLDQYKFPNIGSDYGYEETANGVEFWVSGIRCAAPVKGDLKVGDYVIVTYLPQSGYILSIDGPNN